MQNQNFIAEDQFTAEDAQLLRELNVNIAAMHVGRKKMSGDAVMGLNLDAEVTPEMMEKFKKTSGFKDIKIVNLY